MASITVIVPCSKCGQRLRGSGAELNKIARCSCGHEFAWCGAALQNPITAPLEEIPSWKFLPGCGVLLSLLAIWGLLFGSRKSSSEFPLVLLALGIALLVISAVRNYITKPIAQRRYERWLKSSEGRKYADFERDIQAAREAFAQAEAAVRAAEEERQRREQAERARSREYLLGLSPRDFERHVAELFAALGYKVQLTPASRDEGVDAYIEKEGRLAIVQCKHLTDGTVSRPALQQFFGVLTDKGAGEGFFVTTGHFSDQATEFTKNKPMHLIDLPQLLQMSAGAFSEEFIRSGPIGKVVTQRRDRPYWH